MKFRNATERNLYFRIAAASTGALINKGRGKPQLVAHMACEYAVAAIRQYRIAERAK